MVHRYPLALEHEPNPAIAKAPAFASDRAHAVPDLWAIGWALAAHRFRIDADQPAGAALRDAVF